MPLHPLLRPPNRVSRLYPLLTLLLMVGSSSLVYAWKTSELNGTSAIQERDRKIQTLSSQVDSLTASAKIDKATLQTQKEQLGVVSDKLTSAESDLKTKTEALSQAQAQLKNQQDQLSANASELEELRNRPPLFSFQNKSSLGDVSAQESALRTVVTSAYDYIQAIYDRPYLLNQITITFVDSFSIPGASGEIEITNGPQGISIDIHIKDFNSSDFEDVNTIIHEIVHGFHGIAVLSNSAMEEGITVATTDAVMRNMIADNKLPQFSHLYLVTSEQLYQSYNKNLTVHLNNDTFYNDPNIAKVYQLVGTAWYKLYNADPDIFKKFNAAYYPKIQKGQTVDAAGIRDIVASLIPSVNGTPIAQFLTDNKAFQPQ